MPQYNYETNKLDVNLDQDTIIVDENKLKVNQDIFDNIYESIPYQELLLRANNGTCNLKRYEINDFNRGKLIVTAKDTNSLEPLAFLENDSNVFIYDLYFNTICRNEILEDIQNVMIEYIEHWEM